MPYGFLADIFEFSMTKIITSKPAVKLCATANTKGRCRIRLAMPKPICVKSTISNTTPKVFNCQYFMTFKANTSK